MGIDKESEVSANLQIGPTSLGMVRIYVETEMVELPLDFDPDEADEIAEEIRAAAVRAREMGGGNAGGPVRGGGKQPEERGGGDGKPPGGKRHDGPRAGSKRRAGSGSSS